MGNRFTGWIRQMAGKLTVNTASAASLALPSLEDSVEHARTEWLSSRLYFETVSDPDLIDHAIYLMEAAEKRYVYLLKKAREAGITVNF